jgi:ComF family protein
VSRDATGRAACRFRLPRTGYHQLDDNPVARQFWGKVPVINATAYYYFSKGERVQKLIHQLKYKGRKDVGIYTGKTLGVELMNSGFKNIDMILPVPLHKSRLKLRGYNQSDCFAEGLSMTMKKDFFTDLLQRIEATSTQTRKHRFDRYKNVENIFNVTDDNMLAGKKILLVDDVITTGSTLISCTEKILTIPGTSVFIAAIACA